MRQIYDAGCTATANKCYGPSVVIITCSLSHLRRYNFKNSTERIQEIEHLTCISEVGQRMSTAHENTINFYGFTHLLKANFGHHLMSVMKLGHLLTRSGLTHLEVSSEVCHDCFCQLGNSVSLSWVVCREAFCFLVVSSSSCIPVVCLEPVLFLIHLQCVNLFCNLSKCILLFF